MHVYTIYHVYYLFACLIYTYTICTRRVQLHINVYVHYLYMIYIYTICTRVLYKHTIIQIVQVQGYDTRIIIYTRVSTPDAPVL